MSDVLSGGRPFSVDNLFHEKAHLLGEKVSLIELFPALPTHIDIPAVIFKLNGDPNNKQEFYKELSEVLGDNILVACGNSNMSELLATDMAANGIPLENHISIVSEDRTGNPWYHGYPTDYHLRDIPKTIVVPTVNGKALFPYVGEPIDTLVFWTRTDDFLELLHLGKLIEKMAEGSSDLKEFFNFHIVLVDGTLNNVRNFTGRSSKIKRQE